MILRGGQLCASLHISPSPPTTGPGPSTHFQAPTCKLVVTGHPAPPPPAATRLFERKKTRPGSSEGIPSSGCSPGSFSCHYLRPLTYLPSTPTPGIARNLQARVPHTHPAPDWPGLAPPIARHDPAPWQLRLPHSGFKVLLGHPSISSHRDPRCLSVPTKQFRKQAYWKGGVACPWTQTVRAEDRRPDPESQSRPH